MSNSVISLAEFQAEYQGESKDLSGAHGGENLGRYMVGLLERVVIWSVTIHS
jgi:hypothetical protein